MEIVATSAVAGVFLAKFTRGWVQSINLYITIVFPEIADRLALFLGPVFRQEVTIESGGRTFKPDIYIPYTKKQLPAIIVYCPLATEGKNHRYVMNFMKGLARMGFVVMAPFWPARKDGEIHIDDNKELQRAIDFITQQSFVSQPKVSIVAISYGIGPTLIAASDHRTREKIHAIVSIGGCADFKKLINFGLTGKAKFQKHRINTNPDPYVEHILLRTIATYLPKADSLTLHRILDEAGPKASIDNDKLKSLISPKSFAAVEHLYGGNYKHLPSPVRQLISRLSAESLIKKVAMPILIFHSKEDALVPYTEALKLYHHSARYGSKLYLVGGFNHAIPQKFSVKTAIGVYLPNVIRVVRFINDLIRQSR